AEPPDWGAAEPPDWGGAELLDPAAVAQPASVAAPPPVAAPAKHATLSPRRLSGWLQQRGIRIDPGHRGGVAMGLAAVLAAVIAGWWVLSSRPHAIAVSSSSASRAVPASSSSTSGAARVRVVVDVVGKVRHPGVYRLADGARVDDALRTAGGALPGVDLSSLNLARKLIDGEQIAVGVTGAAPGAAAPSGSGAGAAAGLVDLNTSTLAQLDTLPGVGPVLAQRILDWRTAHGRFDSIDQLREVTGIGPSRFDDLRPLVTV
ncbi:MAG TPA: ComEA family DNA-binding protein, partial [Jatrophihabitantaceae bacterium]|nr:ComEA family DNA-binding protein [Jatrophihabitantaceae bacterium]